MNSTEEITRIAAGLIFAGFAGLTVYGALVAAISRRPVLNVCGLAMAFMGLSGLYYFLHSPFLALMQVLIYVGVICVVIMFAMMLAESHEDFVAGRSETIRDVIVMLVAAIFAAALMLLAGGSAWMPRAVKVNAGNVKDMGRELLGIYGFAFELISLLLMLAILGALVVARSGRRTKP